MNQPSANEKITILKLGGSLLTLPNVAERLIQLIDKHRIEKPMVIVGGGATADIVRHWDQLFELDADLAHDLALRAMSLNARMLAALDPRFHMLDASVALDGLTDSEAPSIVIIQPHAMLEKLEQAGRVDDLVERSWHVTSDSIAAWIACQMQVERLILLKSTGLPVASMSPDRQHRSGSEHRAGLINQLMAGCLVDSEFAKHSVRLPHLSWCNLREDVDKQTSYSICALW